MSFVAYYCSPGHMPDSSEPPNEFDTAQEAWDYLANERTLHEDLVEPDTIRDAQHDGYSDTRETLAVLGTYAHWGNSHTEVTEWLHEKGLTAQGCGTIQGWTPGYVGDHDLGIAYTVDVT